MLKSTQSTVHGILSLFQLKQNFEMFQMPRARPFEQHFTNFDDFNCLNFEFCRHARSMIETVKRYPFGLTEAVILAELELLW